jgi:hypothetical protein
MLGGLRSLWKKLSGSSLQRNDFSTESRHHVENYDAAAASHLADIDPQGSDGRADFPPNYVRPVDEGRPRK